MPLDQFTNIPDRMFCSAGGKEDWTTSAANLAANPDVRNNEAKNVTATCLIQDPSTGSTDLTTLASTIASLRALPTPMPAVPGFRLIVNTPWTTLFTTAYWFTVATWFHNVALRRAAGDPRVNLDAENYTSVGIGAGVEPSASSIAAVNVIGGYAFTPALLRTAMQPLIDQIIADNANIIGMYPIVSGSASDSPLIPRFIAQAIGLDRVCFWWETSTFEISEKFRKDPLFSANAAIVNQGQQQAEFDRTLRETDGLSGQAQHLAASDEDEGRAWGKRWAAGTSVPTVGDNASSIGLRWWFDTTRFSPTKYTATWFSGLNISPLNGVDHAVYMNPAALTNAVGSLVSVRAVRGATPLTSEVWAGTASAQAVSGSALVNASIVGLQIPVPVGAFTWCGLRYPNTLPAINTDAWTKKLHDITVPSSIVSDTPLWSVGQNNVQVAVLWWIEATAEFRLLVKASGVNAYTLATGLAKDTAHRPVIGRNGLTWRHSINGGAAVDRVAPSQAGVFQSPTYGMGCCDQTMANNTQVPGTGIIFTDQELNYVDQTIAGVVVPGFRSAVEFAQISNRAAGPVNNYPFGWFT